jgi:thiol-disulfide isomerase/thioredoxin
MRVLVVVAVGLAVMGCGTPTPSGKGGGAAGKGVQIAAAAHEGEAAAVVAGELQKAKREGRQLLVYVGATWCEPCRRFHQAAAEHKLDADFPTLRLLEFDSDRDGERLAVAGYVSQLIPLFARPRDDGRASGRQIEGSVKGDGAVVEIVPRLRSLLGP